MENELSKYSDNIFNLKMETVDNYGSRTGCQITINVGTFWKPIGYMVRDSLIKQGYTVKLRGRGDRSAKYHNSHKDIRLIDSVFVAVYATKKGATV
jgi:hypothetical protein